MSSIKTIDQVVRESGIPISKMSKAAKCKKNRVSQVYFSCNYLTPRDSQELKFIHENRVVNCEKVKQMLEGISNDGAVTPVIICNYEGDSIVVDGQHRAVVCYLLGYKIPYVSVSSTQLHKELLEQIKALNTNQKNWSNKDYLRYYRERRVQFFSFFEQAKERAPSGTSSDSILSIMLGKPTKMKDIRSMSEEELDRNIAELGNKYKRNIDRAMYFTQSMVDIFGFSSFIFIEGFCYFLVDVGVQSIGEDFISYVDENIDKEFRLPPQTTPAWKAYFKDIYHNNYLVT